MLSDDELVKIWMENGDGMLAGLRAVAEAAVKDAVGGEAAIPHEHPSFVGYQFRFKDEPLKWRNCDFTYYKVSLEHDECDGRALYTRPQASAAVPEGFSLVPSKMVLTPESMEALMFTVGGTEADNQSAPLDERWLTGVLFVGYVMDDDGTAIHGLHVYSDEYPEEGSTTLVEFERVHIAASQPEVKS